MTTNGLFMNKLGLLSDNIKRFPMVLILQFFYNHGFTTFGTPIGIQGNACFLPDA